MVNYPFGNLFFFFIKELLKDISFTITGQKYMLNGIIKKTNTLSRLYFGFNLFAKRKVYFPSMSANFEEILNYFPFSKGLIGLTLSTPKWVSLPLEQPPGHSVFS